MKPLIYNSKRSKGWMDTVKVSEPGKQKIPYIMKTTTAKRR